MCLNTKSKCQRQIIFTPRNFQLEGAGLKIAMKKRIQKELQKQEFRFFNCSCLRRYSKHSITCYRHGHRSKKQNFQVRQGMNSLLKRIS